MSDIIDVYEMTSLQAGMLFHSLHAPASGMYFQQYWCKLDGALDEGAFRAAWDKVIARHEILRSQCHWEDLDTPAHVIHDVVAPEWQCQDWQDTGDDHDRLTTWLEADREQGFDMGACPLMRFALMQVAPETHVFVWSFHHLLIDGWCGALLVREMLEFYGGAADKPHPIPYKSYVDWLAARDHGQDEEYWRNALSGVEETTPLGIDHATTGQTGVIEHRSFLSRDLTEKLTGLIRKERLTLNTMVQGAWGLILSRYCGQGDVCFGTVLSGRPPELPGIEDMIGLFLNTVPARVSVEDQVLLPWLHNLQKEQRQREEFGHAALTNIQQWSGLGAATPLFESLLIVETYPQSIEAVAERNGLALKMRDTGIHERTNYPLTLKILPGDEIEICLVADASRLTSAALKRLGGHIAQVLESFSNSPDQRLTQVCLSSDSEHNALIAMGQGPEHASAPLTLDQILARSLTQPTTEAIRTLTVGSLTYDDVDRRSAEIATTLAARGVQRGDVIAVCQDRTPDLLLTLLAIWRVGAAYLPLDPIYPADRIAYILSDSGAQLAVVDDFGLTVLDQQSGIDLLNVADCQSASGDFVEPHTDDLAYILYTSGSTGNPKGVCIAHGALANFLASMVRTPGITSKDRVLALTTVSFDIAALELFGPLYAGGLVVLGETGLGADGGRVAKALLDNDITLMQATPAGWRVLIEAGWSNESGLKMLSGGEALDGALARHLLTGAGNLWNLYGPTETTIWSAAMQIKNEDVQGAKTPVGGPLGNTQLYVLDRAGYPAPTGVAGELLIGGAGLSLGYHKRPDLTEDRFVTDLLPGAGRLYRTGDNVRWSDDGTLEFLGRLDDQVKLRGYRIELGEIEARLEAHPDIQQAVVIVRDDGLGDRLVGYLRSRATMPPAQQLRDHLADVLPSYMIPAAWVEMEDFPLTPNGKINRRALPSPQREPAEQHTETSVQVDLIAEIWCDVLDVDQVQADDTFFDLGGHSLVATRLVGAVGQALSVEVTLRDLFEASDFAAFCARVSELKGGQCLPSLSKATGAPILSYAQHRQWLMAQFNPADTAYLLPLTIHLDGPLELDALVAAFEAMASRHEILRSCFPAHDGQASVTLQSSIQIDLTVEDLSPLDPLTQTQRITNAQHDEARIPFDIASAPPWRVRLLRCGSHSHVLLITLHHILADEWSFAVMLEELRAGYADAVDSSPSSKGGTSADALQYSDFSAWQRALDLTAERDYWRWQLDAVSPLLQLPTDFVRPNQRSASGGRVPVQLCPDATRALRDLARGQGASLFMGLLAAYAVFLQRHTDQNDLQIGTPVSNRQMPETQGMIGLFVNTLAIRATFDDELTFADLLTQVRETLLAAHANQNIPFEQVIEALNLPRSESYAPLVQTLFSMQTLPTAGRLHSNLEWHPQPGNEVNARFDLSLSLRETSNGLEGYFEYASDLFTRASVERFAARFEALLGEIANGFDTPVVDLPLLTLGDMSDVEPKSRKAQPEGATILQSISATKGEALAIEFGETRLTYAELQHVLTQSDRTPVVQSGMANIDQLIDHLILLQNDQVEVDGVWHTQTSVLQMGNVPLHANARVEWDGAVSGLGLVQAIVALTHGSALVQTQPNAFLIEAGDGFELEQPGNRTRILSSPEFPMAMEIKAETLPVSATETQLMHPRPGVVAYVLLRSGQHAPTGVSGELCLTGSGLARGYVRDAARTAERFQPNPHTDPQNFRAEEACLWRSGLAAKRTQNGPIQLLGQISEQANIVGQRISPAEIEAHLLDHPVVAQAVLLVPEGSQRQIEAVLVSTQGAGQPSDDDIVRHLLARLPDYLVPRRLYWLDALPKDDAGTVDRAAVARIVQATSPETPQGIIECKLAQIWEAVLKVSNISRHDNFFDLGGDSILAMQIVTRMGEAGYLVEPRTLFRHQTIASLTDCVQVRSNDTPRFDLPEIEGLDMDELAGSVSFGDA